MNRKKLAERDAIAEQYAARVPAVVSAFVRKNPSIGYLFNDMCAEAVYRVLYAANRHVCVATIEKMPGYMHRVIMTGIFLAIREDKGIQKPRDCSARKTGSADSEATMPLYDTLESTDSPLLDKCCLDDADLDILKLRFRGASFRAIAERLRVTPAEVRKRLSRIERRLDEGSQGNEPSREDGTGP